MVISVCYTNVQSITYKGVDTAFFIAFSSFRAVLCINAECTCTMYMLFFGQAVYTGDVNSSNTQRLPTLSQGPRRKLPFRTLYTFTGAQNLTR